MSAALSSAESPKTWWSLSKSPSSKDLRQKYVQETPAAVKASKFNSFASAIGFKPKKSHPSLAIQDPPSFVSNPVTLPSPNPVSPVSVGTRPSSKAASSTRSRVDSMEPRTPSDFHRDRRQSLLTLSDIDPFAGRPVITVPLPHLPSDPNRLSAYSNPSVTELSQKKGDPSPANRVSYASSSSNSNYHSTDFPPVPTAVPGKGEFRHLQNKRSVGSLQIKRSDPLSRQGSMTPSMKSGSRSGSSSTVAPVPRPVTQPDGGPTRPKMRARGMTDGGSATRAGFFVEEQSHFRKPSPKSISSTYLPPSPEIPSAQGPSNSPRVVVRQASASRLNTPPSRLNTPPSAPPTHRLPTPPYSPPQGSTNHQRASDTRTESASSSLVSFSSAISLTNDMFASPPFEKRGSERSFFSQITHDEPETSLYTTKESKTAPSSPRTLKKVLSHQSLSRRNQTAPSPTPKTPDPPPEKVFRKQRSFHHPRLPIPHIPLSTKASSSSNSTTFPSLAEFVKSPVVDQQRGSSASGRKRLFSNNSSHHRPATAQPTSTIDDDKRSLFSLRSDTDSYLAPYKSWFTTTPQPTSSSFWDEASSDRSPSSPVRPVADYMPQAIMSKAELARLEASVDSSPRTFTRTRGFSLLSASTMASDLDPDYDSMPAGLSPPPPTSRPSSKQMSTRMSSNSYTAKTSGSNTPQPHSPVNLSTDRDDLSDSRRKPLMSSAISQVTMRPASPAYATMTSLPPPPRRSRPILLSQPDLPKSLPLSRAPSIQKSVSSIGSKSAVEKTIHRRSIMRKPSFLDIDGDTDEDTESECFDPRVTGSFLDLARESFDTVRSDT